MPDPFNCLEHGLSYTGACPACADEPDPPAKMTMTMDDWVQRYEAAAGIVLPPPAVGNAQEWRDLCTAQSAEIEALRTSLERALSRIASLSAERDGFRVAAEQHAAEIERYKRRYDDAAVKMVRPPTLTKDQWADMIANRPAIMLPGKITYVNRPRLSAGWEDQPCVTTGARVTSTPDPLLRAIGARPRPVGLLTERGV